MCRKLIVTNKLSLGNRELGWEAYSMPKGEVLEFTGKQLKDAITRGTDEVYGLRLSDDGELVFDREGFYTVNMMNKLHINTLVPIDETECMANLFYTVIGTCEKDGKMLYDAVSSRYERVLLTEEKAKIMIEMGIISSGAKLDGDRIAVAPLEKKAEAEKAAEDGGAGGEKGEAAGKVAVKAKKEAVKKEKAG